MRIETKPRIKSDNKEKVITFKNCQIFTHQSANFKTSQMKKLTIAPSPK